MNRYGRFVTDPTPEELEKFFFLNEAALAEVRDLSGPSAAGPEEE